MKKTIAIIGAGMMGSALSIPLSDNGHEIRIIGTHLDNEIIDHAKVNDNHKTMKRALPKGIAYYYYEELSKAVQGADIIVCGVSSFGVDWYIENVMPKLDPAVPMISVTKGLVCEENGNLISFPHYMKKRGMGHFNLNAIGGPCTSYELADRRHSCVAFCGDDINTLKMLKSVFETDYYHISLSTDVAGVECAVAMKNAYALAVTMAVGMIEKQEGEGCTLAYNPQAAIFGQSVREMRRLLKLVGGHDDNVIYAAGDLYVTVYGGRTRLLGTLLGRGLTMKEALEKLSGVTLESVSIAGRTYKAIKLLSQRGVVKEEDYPILMYIGSLLNGEEDTGMPWAKFEEERF